MAKVCSILKALVKKSGLPVASHLGRQAIPDDGNNDEGGSGGRCGGFEWERGEKKGVILMASTTTRARRRRRMR